MHTAEQSRAGSPAGAAAKTTRVAVAEGCVVMQTFVAADLPATVSCNVPGGGVGGEVEDHAEPRHQRGFPLIEPMGPERTHQVLPLEVVRNGTRMGTARTVERLLKLALERTDRPKRDMAVVLHADFTHSVTALPELIKKLDAPGGGSQDENGAGGSNDNHGRD